MANALSSTYLRSQAERCQRLSRMCMDLGTARDLRLMAEEYLAEAARLEKTERESGRNAESQQVSHHGMTGPSAHMQQQSQQQNGPKQRR